MPADGMMAATEKRDLGTSDWQLCNGGSLQFFDSL
jgi:hypothetical protein